MMLLNAQMNVLVSSKQEVYKSDRLKLAKIKITGYRKWFVLLLLQVFLGRTVHI